VLRLERLHTCGTRPAVDEVPQPGPVRLDDPRGNHHSATRCGEKCCAEGSDAAPRPTVRAGSCGADGWMRPRVGLHLRPSGPGPTAHGFTAAVLAMYPAPASPGLPLLVDIMYIIDLAYRARFGDTRHRTASLCRRRRNTAPSATSTGMRCRPRPRRSEQQPPAIGASRRLDPDHVRHPSSAVASEQPGDTARVVLAPPLRPKIVRPICHPPGCAVQSPGQRAGAETAPARGRSQLMVIPHGDLDSEPPQMWASPRRWRAASARPNQSSTGRLLSCGQPLITETSSR
jgi:hypothetical protein